MVRFGKAGHLLESSLGRCETVRAISEEGKYATACWLKHSPLTPKQGHRLPMTPLVPPVLCGVPVSLCLVSVSKTRTLTQPIMHTCFCKQF